MDYWICFYDTEEKAYCIMIKVAVNGYGTIGKRVADAVSAQPDMEIIGVSKTKPGAEAFVAKERGYPLYIADITKKEAFEKAGIPVAGSVEEMIQKADSSMQHPEVSESGTRHSTRSTAKKRSGRVARIMRWPDFPSTHPVTTKMQSADSMPALSPATQPVSAASSILSTLLLV